jgi:hypothetical protein
LTFTSNDFQEIGAKFEIGSLVQSFSNDDPSVVQTSFAGVAKVASSSTPFAGFDWLEWSQTRHSRYLQYLIIIVVLIDSILQELFTLRHKGCDIGSERFVIQGSTQKLMEDAGNRSS